MAAVIAIVNLVVAFARPKALGLDRLIGVAGVVIAPGIGWLLAQRVLRGGNRAVVVAGFQFALVAVLVRPLLLSRRCCSVAAGRDKASRLESACVVLQWAILGLLFKGRWGCSG